MKLLKRRNRVRLTGEILRAFGTLNIMCHAKRDHEEIRTKIKNVEDKFMEYLKYD
jgi:hypothetical protein